jgi:hypothetical protein
MRDKGRPLTAAERNLAASMFGGAIDYDRVRIHAAKWWPFQPRRVTMAPDGHIWFHPQGGLYCDDFAAHDLGTQGLFVHELTHVWQHQRGIFLPLARHPFCRYISPRTRGCPLARTGLEQPAYITPHPSLLSTGAAGRGAPPLQQYETLLPF